MSKIILKNSCIEIEDYTLGQCPKLEYNFQIWNPITHRFDVLGMKYEEENHKLILPRGIDIWKIKQYLNEKVCFTKAPNDYETADILMRYAPRDDIQRQALRFMCGVEEYEENYSLPQLSVNLPTGKGKTYCSIATIAYLKIKSIVITYSITLLNQWKENIKEYTNLSEKDILFINGSQTMNMILQNKSTRAKAAKIFLCTHGTIRSYCDEYGWDKLNQIFQILGIGIKIFDEAHLNFENILLIDFYTNVFKTYYVTATPKRSDYREDRIYQLSIKNVPFVDLFDENNDPHTDYVAIKWNSRPTPSQISACRNMYGLDRNKYINYVVHQENFYLMMRIIMDMVIKCKGRVLFYIGTNEAILTVYKWMSENYPEFIGDIGIYTSLVDKDQKMKEKNKKLLLSTTKSAGLGEHIAGLKMTIVLAEPFKSEVLARQSLGRTRDPGTVYVELVDMGFKYVRNFYYAKLPIMNKYALSTSDTVIDQYELTRRAALLEKQREKPGIINPIRFRDERFFDYSQEDAKEKKIIKPIYFLQ